MDIHVQVKVNGSSLWQTFYPLMFQSNEKIPHPIILILLLKYNSQTSNPGHNILELYNVLVHVRFSTSKTKLDI